MYTLSSDKKVAVVAALLEGNSIRSIERMTGVHRDTICRLLVSVGHECEMLMLERMRNLKIRRLECDEIWTYVGKKRRNVRDDDPPEMGDQWVFVGMDADSKLIPVFTVGKRNEGTTREFISELASRVPKDVQITTDGFHLYRRQIKEQFGEAHYAQLIKLFGEHGQEREKGPDRRYSPGTLTEVISAVRQGSPDPAHISTSFVERQNLTMRMQMRRFTRLTNAFSRKLANLKAAVALHFAHYNFCRVHQTLRVTPAMEAGLTNHVWTIAELVSLLDSRSLLHGLNAA